MQVLPHAKALLAERLCVRTGETEITGLWLAFCRPRGSSFAGCNRRRVGQQYSTQMRSRGRY